MMENEEGRWRMRKEDGGWNMGMEEGGWKSLHTNEMHASRS